MDSNLIPRQLQPIEQDLEKLHAEFEKAHTPAALSAVLLKAEDIQKRLGSLKDHFTKLVTIAEQRKDSLEAVNTPHTSWHAEREIRLQKAKNIDAARQTFMKAMPEIERRQKEAIAIAKSAIALRRDKIDVAINKIMANYEIDPHTRTMVGKGKADFADHVPPRGEARLLRSASPGLKDLERVQTGLTEAQLRKILLVAFTTPLKTGSACLIEVEGQRYLLSRKREDKIGLSAWQHQASQIGAGSFGKVSQVWEVTKGIFFAEKVAVLDPSLTPETRQEQMALIQNGQQKLQYIRDHAPRGVEGIGLPTHYIPPERVTKVYTSSGWKDISIEGGVLHARKAKLGDLFAFLTTEPSPVHLTPQIRFKLAGQLLKGLVEIQELGILHGDIKTDNILVDINRDGTIKLSLIDFDGAIYLTKRDGHPCELPVTKIVSDHPWGNLWTPEYTSAWDAHYLQRQQQAFANVNPHHPHYETLRQGAQNAYNTLQFKRDVYAMGCAICALLTGAPPFDESASPAYWRLDPSRSHIHPWIQNELRYISTEVGGPVFNLIDRMLKVDPGQRCSAKEALQMYNDILAQQVP